MMRTPQDIILTVRIDVESGADSRDILDVLALIENAIYHSDRREIEYVTKSLGMPRLVADAAKERLRSYKDARFRVGEAHAGSIVFEGAVVAVALYVLKKTVGEALNEGFKRSDVREQMTEFFRHQIDEKAMFITDKLRELFQRTTSLVRIDHEARSPEHPHRIRIDVKREKSVQMERPGTLGEELDK